MPSDLLRRIWSNSNCLLLIFAGSSAEFAVHPAADWLFYTGVLPADPIGRFVSTVAYVRRLVFAQTEATYSSIAREIRGLHTALEARRGRRIPAPAYRDVLFMNLEYSLRSFPLVFGRQLNASELDTIVRDFHQAGSQMSVPNMPADHAAYLAIRGERLAAFRYTEWTGRLLHAYRQAVGRIGFYFLASIYGGLVNPRILQALRIRPNVSSWLFQQFCHPACEIGLNKVFFAWLLPPRVKRIVRAWDVPGVDVNRVAGGSTL